MVSNPDRLFSHHPVPDTTLFLHAESLVLRLDTWDGVPCLRLPHRTVYPDGFSPFLSHAPPDGEQEWWALLEKQGTRPGPALAIADTASSVGGAATDTMWASSRLGSTLSNQNLEWNAKSTPSLVGQSPSATDTGSGSGESVWRGVTAIRHADETAEEDLASAGARPKGDRWLVHVTSHVHWLQCTAMPLRSRSSANRNSNHSSAPSTVVSVNDWGVLLGFGPLSW